MNSFRRTSLAFALALAGVATPVFAGPPSTAFTYQGELKENGHAVSETLPMTFRLYNAATGGTMLAQVTKSTVQVEGGRFTESLDFPVATLNSTQALWLEVVVNGVTLEERQQVTGSAYSLSTRGITVDTQNKVGIGTHTPSRKLSVEGGLGVYDASGEGIAFVTHDLSFSDSNEDSFYRFFSASQSHVFSTNGSDRVSIDAAGRVGIGTTTPGAPLHVQAPAGDASVKLPDSSVGPDELVAEPGLAAVRHEHMASLGSSIYGVYIDKIVASRTINAPADGYLVVIGTGRLLASQSCTFKVHLDGVPQGQGDLFDPASGHASVSQTRVVPVTQGMHTISWVSHTDVGDLLFPSLTVMYFPTAYGDVTLP